MLRHIIHAFDAPPRAGNEEAAAEHPQIGALAKRAAFLFRFMFLIILSFVIFMYIYHHFFTGDTVASGKMQNLATQLIGALALHNNGVEPGNYTSSE